MAASPEGDSMTTNALVSLYGGKQARAALAGTVGGQARKQEVHTPDEIWDVVFRVFKGQLDYDPSAASDPACWRAAYNETLPAAAVELERFLHAPETSKEDKKAIELALAPFYAKLPAYSPPRRYVDKEQTNAYSNPPYGWLEEWLPWFAQRQLPTIALFPIRPRTGYWCRWISTATDIRALRGIKFKGWDQAFPESLCLAAWHCELGDLGELGRGRLRVEV